MTTINEMHARLDSLVVARKEAEADVASFMAPIKKLTATINSTCPAAAELVGMDAEETRAALAAAEGGHDAPAPDVARRERLRREAEAHHLSVESAKRALAVKEDQKRLANDRRAQAEKAASIVSAAILVDAHLPALADEVAELAQAYSAKLAEAQALRDFFVATAHRWREGFLFERIEGVDKTLHGAKQLPPPAPVDQSPWRESHARLVSNGVGA